MKPGLGENGWERGEKDGRVGSKVEISFYKRIKEETTANTAKSEHNSKTATDYLPLEKERRPHRKGLSGRAEVKSWIYALPQPKSIGGRKRNGTGRE